MECLTKRKFPKVRPRFLRNPQTGRNLELDGFCADLQLAFEYDGEGHHCWPNAFHRTREAFDRQQQRDALKNQLCENAGVTLLRVPHTIAFDEIEQFITESIS